MQLSLFPPEPPAPVQPMEIEVDAATLKTACEILARILAQSVETTKPQESNNE